MKREKKRLVLIDGKSVFYRGYYAMGNLSRADGTPTGAVYGFAAIAMEIVKRLLPTKVVVAWDSKTSVKRRRELYPEYKAGRAKPGEDFYAQIPLLIELVSDLGWNFCEVEEYEADDIIGTLSKEADEEIFDGECRWETYIISSDLDMLQIVDENTRMWRILKGFTNIEEVDILAIEKRYGIKKDQFLDFKAIKGDASDNIPGVPGIGEKGAAQLLNKYGTLENLLLHADEVKGAIGEKLRAGAESAILSKKLAKIQFDAPVELDKMKDFSFDEEKMVKGLEKLEFRSLIKKFTQKEQGEEPLFREEEEKAKRAKQKAEIMEEARAKAEERKKEIILEDSEMAISPLESEESKRGEKRLGEEQRKEVVQENKEDLGTENGWPREAEKAEFADFYVGKDVKNEMHQREELSKEIVQGVKVWDLAQADFLIDPVKKKEKRNSAQSDLLAQIDAQNEDIEAKKQEFLRQKEIFEKRKALFLVFSELDMPLVPVLFKMEKRGMKIERKYFEGFERELTGETEKLTQEVYELSGTEFNINSPIQLSEVLFEKLGLPTNGIKKTTKGYSTGAGELEKLKGVHPVVEKILEYREKEKLLTTYVKPLQMLADGDSRVHTTFTQDVTATGRLSSVNPNLQNIPTRTEMGKKIRTGFVAEEGKILVSADYSQFELRLAAALSGDEKLIQTFNAGIDVHKQTAAEAFHVPFEQVTKTQRRAAKVINFGILYGMSARGLKEAAGMNYYEAKNFIDEYNKVRAPVREYLNKIIVQAREKGYVETLYGRRKPTPDVLAKNGIVRAAAERAAQNMPIQGTEADLMKKAMIKVDRELPEGAGLVMQVHDSLIVECEEKLADAVAEILRREMENVEPRLNIKLAVEVTKGKNWGEL